MTDRTMLNVLIPRELKAELKRQAKRYGISMSAIVVLRLQFKNPAAAL